MKYEDIKDFSQRCEEHPDHQTGMISERMIQDRLSEEIDELRAYIETKQKQGDPVAEVTSETGAEITMSWWHEPALPIGTKLYTTPQQRTWVGLTNEERLKLYRKFEDYLESDNWEYEKAIEAELMSKNI